MAGDRSWLRLRAKPLSDDEFVERIRRRVASHRRWRWWLAGLYGTLAVVFVGLLASFASRAVALLQWLGDLRGGLGGFGIGIALGLAVGMMGHMIGHGLASALLPPRIEELLVHYHDAAEGVTCEASQQVLEVQRRSTR